jgi:hypothetical protein
MALNVKKCAADDMLARMDVKVEIAEVPTPGPDGELNLYSLLVDGGLSLPRGLRASVAFEPALTYEVELSLDVRARRYSVTQLTLRAPSGLTATSVRDTGLPRILHAIAEGDPFAALTETRSTKHAELRALSTSEGLALWRERARSETAGTGPTDDMLRWVSRVYVWFAAIGGRPAKGVENALQIPSRTATRWIAAARERGLIGPGRSNDASPTDAAE